MAHAGVRMVVGRQAPPARSESPGPGKRNRGGSFWVRRRYSARVSSTHRRELMNQAIPHRGTDTDDPVAEEVVGRLMSHRHRLYAFIAKQLVNHTDVEDVLQKTSIVVWRKAGSYDPKRSFFHWACGIAHNEARNFLRTRGRGRLHFDPDLVETLAGEAEGEGDTSAARLEALRVCMSTLEERQRTIVEGSYGGRATITELAVRLGRSRDALYKQLSRIRAKLLDCIRKRMAEEDSAR